MTCQNLSNCKWLDLHNGKALLSGFEFEKQKYMTIDEIKAKAEMLLKNSRESQGEFVQMYNNGFEDGVNFVLQNLQQCNVSGRSKLLVCGNCLNNHTNKQYEGYCSQSCFDGIK